MKVRELLNESNWVKGHSALNRDYEPILPWLSDACKWCLSGAIYKCYPVHEQHDIFMVIKHKLGIYVTTWNDHPERTWTDVKKLIEELDI